MNITVVLSITVSGSAAKGARSPLGVWERNRQMIFVHNDGIQHHARMSPLFNVPTGLITAFPRGYMQMLCLVTVRSLVALLHEGI